MHLRATFVISRKQAHHTHNYTSPGLTEDERIREMARKMIDNQLVDHKQALLYRLLPIVVHSVRAKVRRLLKDGTRRTMCKILPTNDTVMNIALKEPYRAQAIAMKMSWWCMLGATFVNRQK